MTAAIGWPIWIGIGLGLLLVITGALLAVKATMNAGKRRKPPY